MTSRERVRRAITFGRPDRVPYFHRFLTATRLRHSQLVESIERRYPGDLADSGWQKAPSTRRVGSSFQNVDEWGCVRATGVEGLTGIVVGHPLAAWQAFDSYRWPDYNKIGGGWDSVLAAVQEYPDKYHWGIIPGLNPFERMQALRGYENLLMDLGMRTPQVYQLRDRVVDTMLVAIDKWTQTSVDTIAFGDDWGTQNSLMISPA